MNCDAEKGVEDRTGEDAREAEGVRAGVRVFKWQWKSSCAQGFQARRRGWEDGVEGEEGKGGQQVEEDADCESADDFDAERRMREDSRKAIAV